MKLLLFFGLTNRYRIFSRLLLLLAFLIRRNVQHFLDAFSHQFFACLRRILYTIPSSFFRRWRSRKRYYLSVVRISIGLGRRRKEEFLHRIVGNFERIKDLDRDKIRSLAFGHKHLYFAGRNAKNDRMSEPIYNRM